MFDGTDGAGRSSRPLLTIAIPTFERARQLAKLLDQIAAEVAPVRDRVAISISDNASGDHTSDVIRTFAARHSDLLVQQHVQTSNIGPIPNVHYLVTHSNGEWTWCIGDDDALVPGALRAIVNFLEEYEGNLLLVRAAGIQEWDRIDSDRSGVLDLDPETTQGAAYLTAAGFLASALLRTNTWRSLIAPASSFGAPNYLNWVAVMLAALSRGRFSVINRPAVHGNANMIGEMRLDKYPVLVAQRLQIWDRLRGGNEREQSLAAVLRPHLARIFRYGWMAVAADDSNHLGGVIRRTALFREGVRMLGWPALTAAPMFLAAALLPPAVRRQIREIHHRWRGRT